ncbi:MAG: hypothetical protein ACRDVM_06555 [Acidimicrobiia bacterium]
MAERSTAGQLWYQASRTGDDWIIRFPRLCEATVEAGGRGVSIHPDPRADPDLVPVVLIGNIMAFLLAIRGHCVLHASAVEARGQGVALVGSSGMGKSTVAALLCSAGATLITDDVLRVDLGNEPICLRGTAQLRLRPAARQILGLFAKEPPTGETADSRVAVLPPRARRRVPLAAVVVPLPSRTDRQVVVQEISGAEALLLLARFPRIYGWREEVVLARNFRQLASLVRQVPVFTARVPWGPPFRPDTSGELLEQIARAV